MRTSSAHFSTAAAVAVATGAGLVGLPHSADAQIIYSGPVNIVVPATTAGVYLNVVTGVSNISPGSVPGWDINPFSISGFSFFNPATPAGGVYVVNAAGGSSATLPDNLVLGFLISGASGFGSGAGETTGSTAFLLNSSNNYVGFRFQNEAAGNAIQFGWAQFQIGATVSTRSIIGFAFESSGAGIAAGDTGVAAVPEPGTYFAGLAAGALALRAWRRRKVA